VRPVSCALIIFACVIDSVGGASRTTIPSTHRYDRLLQRCFNSCDSDIALQVHMLEKRRASAALGSATPWVRLLCVICIRAMQRSTEPTSFPFEVWLLSGGLLRSRILLVLSLSLVCIR
jgi:hypothetical protein